MSTEINVGAYNTYANDTKSLKKGFTDVYNDQRSERPSVSDEMIAKVIEAMLKD